MVEMVELRNMPGYLPPEGPLFARHYRLEINGEVFRGDESSLIPEGRISQGEKPLGIDPEPLPYFVSCTMVD